MIYATELLQKQLKKEHMRELKVVLSKMAFLQYVLNNASK
jgi:hypothetical protein